MKKLFLLLIIGICFSVGCASYGRFSSITPLSNSPYVILYGREDCPACQNFKQDLNKAQVSYVFKDLNDWSVQNELHPRMEQAGVDTSYYLLPVVDVNGNLAAHPKLNDVLELYRSDGTVSHEDK